MSIETTHICPPIPDRSHDWHAHFDWQSADDLTCEGFGATEESAVIDLMTNALEVEEDGSEQEEVAEMAIEGWLLQKDKGLRLKVEVLLESLKSYQKVCDRLQHEDDNEIARTYQRISAQNYSDVCEKIARLLK